MMTKGNKYPEKPKDFSTKLKQMKKEFLSQDRKNSNPYPLFYSSKMKSIENNNNISFKQKYYELAKITGNDLINRKEEKMGNWLFILNFQKHTEQKGSKSDKLKKEILKEITDENKSSIFKRGKSMNEMHI